jgi:DNA-binding IclR family transcriptional regulator
VLDALAENLQRGLTVVEMAKVIGVVQEYGPWTPLMVLEQWRFVFSQSVKDRYVLWVKLFQLGSLPAPENYLRDRAASIWKLSA